LVHIDPGQLVLELGHGAVEEIRQTTFQADPVKQGKLNVFDGTTLLNQFDIASIKKVAVNVANLDAVNVDDSNGMPFAAKTVVSLFGNGSSNSLNLTGSGTISGGEKYAAGAGGTAGSLSLGGVTFKFSDVIGTVTDEVTTTAPLVVSSPFGGSL